MEYVISVGELQSSRFISLLGGETMNENNQENPKVEKMKYRGLLKIINSDFSSGVDEAYSNAKQQSEFILDENLDAQNRKRLSALKKELEATNTEFGQAKEVLKTENARIIEENKKNHLIMTLVPIGVIVLGVIIAMVGLPIVGLSTKVTVLGLIGLGVFVVGVIGLFICEGVELKKIRPIANDWENLFLQYKNKFGWKDSLHQQAAGLYKQIDDVYLASLDPTSRQTEILRRDTVKFHERQEEMHAQQIAQMQAQTEELKKMADRNDDSGVASGIAGGIVGGIAGGVVRDLLKK
jgi:hypothetical protein